VIGKILNYCSNLRIQNIGANTLEELYANGFLDHGIRSLYKLRKHSFDIQDLNGFGKLKTNKIINEIESKRKLKDYELFGSLGIAGLSMKTFKTIFQQINYDAFIKLLFDEKFDPLKKLILFVDGMAEAKTNLIIDAFQDEEFRKDLKKLLKELQICSTFDVKPSEYKGIVVFTGFRSKELEDRVEKAGWKVAHSVSSKTSHVIAANQNGSSSKIQKARELKIPILGRDQINQLL
jgi:DNA ligase (NAD+)